jgi:WS/DGAT/MGAT family acyltransferase
LASRIASQQLDRSKPLWENWLVEGLEGDRFALISKTHHSLVDGVSGVDLASVLFDLEPSPAKPSEDLEPWRPQPEPSQRQLVAAGVRGMVNQTVSMASRAVSAATRPATTFNVIKDAAEGIGEIAWAGLNPAPQTPLNVEIGPHRRFSVVRQQLAEYKEVKNALGGTVNDVVLSVVSGALAQWLHSRGVRTEGLEMRALVPVSVRTQDQRHTLGNQLTVMRGPLPVYITDPVARLHFVSGAMNGLKESKQAVGAATLVAVNNLAPPTILAQASRLNFSTRLFNLIVTNIPGPQVPLYLLGRRLEDLFPIAFLPENHALAIAIMSYNGGIDYGLLGDYDALPDIDVVAAGIDEALRELLAIARGEQTNSRSRPARSRSRSSTRPAKTGATAVAAPADPAPTAASAEPAVALAEEPMLPLPSARVKTGPAADMRAKRNRERSRRPESSS